MANTKISGLSSASTPLTGSEIVPLNQSGVTDSVSVANLTAGRAVSAASLTLSTGNVTQGASGTGYNFTANTPASGHTSQLLNWYEEGIWTPSLAFGGNSSGLTYNGQNGQYTRIGNTVYFTLFIQIQQVGSSTGSATISGLPFTSANVNSKYYSFSTTLQNSILLTGAPFSLLPPNSSTLTIYQTSASGSANVTNANFQTYALNNIIITGSYQVT